MENHLVTDPARALNINLSDCTIITDLSERLRLITLEQIEAAGRRLKPLPKKAKVVGVIREQRTRALFTLWRRLGAEAEMEQASASLAPDERLEKDHRENHALLDMLGDSARDLFWGQAKIDLGFLRFAGTAIYADWQLAEEKPESGVSGFVEMLSRGPFQFGGSDGE